jgi:hypothetical protein
VRTSAVLVKPVAILCPSFSCYFMGPWWRCFRTWKIHVLLDASPVPSDARAKLASIVRKPSVYAGKNEPTAVYDAALCRVCQSKNRGLFCF